MKIKLDGKSLMVLKSKDQYKKWKQEVKMVTSALGVSYLLFLPEHTPPTLPHDAPTPPTTPNTTNVTDVHGDGGEGGSAQGVPVNISRMDRGKRRARDDDDEYISKERWERKSDQIVSQLYFYVSPLYQTLILNLTPKNLPHLF